MPDQRRTGCLPHQSVRFADRQEKNEAVSTSLRSILRRHKEYLDDRRLIRSDIMCRNSKESEYKTGRWRHNGHVDGMLRQLVYYSPVHEIVSPT